MSLEKSVFNAFAALLSEVDCAVKPGFDGSAMEESQLVIAVKTQRVHPCLQRWWAFVDFVGAVDIPSDKDGSKLDEIMTAVETLVEGLTLAQFDESASGIALDGVVPDAPSDFNIPSGLENNFNTRSKSVKLAIRRVAI
jgi:hypothetical protein